MHAVSSESALIGCFRVVRGLAGDRPLSMRQAPQMIFQTGRERKGLMVAEGAKALPIEESYYLEMEKAPKTCRLGARRSMSLMRRSCGRMMRLYHFLKLA